MPLYGSPSGGRPFDQIAAAVGWLARKRSVARDVAEEAVQEALLQLVESTAVVSPTNLGGWLRRTAERRLIDAERHRRTQVPAPLDLSSFEEAALEPPDLDAILSLRSRLRSFDPELQTLVVLRLMGATWSEVAALTKLGEDAARKRFERALVELREAIDGEREGTA